MRCKTVRQCRGKREKERERERERKDVLAMLMRLPRRKKSYFSSPFFISRVDSSANVVALTSLLFYDRQRPISKTPKTREGD